MRSFTHGKEKVNTQDTGWHSGVRSCTTPALLEHLVQELVCLTLEECHGCESGCWHVQMLPVIQG